MEDTTEVTRMISSRLPVVGDDFNILLYQTGRDDKEHLAIVLGEIEQQEQVLVRVHSECLTGDVFGSMRCDCGDQLHIAIQRISDRGSGVLIYLRQEGRGIGLLEKLRAYNLQDKGYDTVDANLMLGHQPDERDYDIAAAILHDLKVRSIDLLTNNPNKIEGLTRSGIEVARREPLQGAITEENANYLETKRYRLNHQIHVSHPTHLDIQPVDSEPDERAS